MADQSQTRKKKVLIIDDDPNFTEELSDYLRNHGFIVFVANTGVEGIQIAQKKYPDVILLDLSFPLMNGFELLEMIKDRQVDSRVIVLTGTTDYDSVIKLIKAGVSDYLVKPCDLGDLILRIERAIEIGIPARKQKEIDDLESVLLLRNSEIEKLKKQLKVTQEKIERISAKKDQIDRSSRWIGYAIRTFYVIISSLITWIFFRSGLILDTKLLFLLPLVLFILLLFPIDRIQKFTAKYNLTETTVDVSDSTKEDQKSGNG